MPVWLVNGCIRRVPEQLPHVGDASGDGGRPPRSPGLRDGCATFGPWRFSKLRLVVETMRSPGSPRSPLPPAHIEQPDSPQESPRSRNTRSRPAASASRFTVDRARHHHARSRPRATCRPRTTAAAASRSGRRRVGAGADEHAVDRQPGERHAGREAHIVERALDRGAPALVARAGGSGTRPEMPSTWLGSVPQVICGSSVLQSSTYVAVELRAVVALERAPMRERRDPTARLSAPTAGPRSRRRSRRPAPRSPSGRPSRC